jgi:hypothetical protein
MNSDRPPAPGAVGLIGLGEIGQVHAAAVRQSRGARLVAVADTVPDLLAPFHAQGIRGYRDPGELIADPEVGTVSVCLPHHLHFPVTLEAIRAGKHVLVEKPLAISVAEGQQMVDAATAAGVGPRRIPQPGFLRRARRGQAAHRHRRDRHAGAHPAAPGHGAIVGRLTGLPRPWPAAAS